MRYIAAIILVLGLWGCAAKVVSSGPRSVVVSGPDAAIADAQKLAEAECQRHGRHARLLRPAGPGSPNFLFDCVE